MRHLLLAAVCGVMSVTACPAQAAVIAAAPAVTLPTKAATAVPPAVKVRPRADAELPEPATWAMLFFGFGSMSFALRRRRRITARIRFA